MPNDPINQQIWNEIKTRLTDATAGGELLEYVNTTSVYEGIRDTIPSGAFPAVIMEPDGEDEIKHTAPQRLLITYRYQVTCVIEHIDQDKQIIGDGTTRGIADIVADVKNVILGDTDGSEKLGLATIVGKGGVLRTSFPATQYFVDNYPMREAVITVEVEAQVIKNKR